MLNSRETERKEKFIIQNRLEISKKSNFPILQEEGEKDRKLCVLYTLKPWNTDPDVFGCVSVYVTRNNSDTKQSAKYTYFQRQLVNEKEKNLK